MNRTVLTWGLMFTMVTLVFAEEKLEISPGVKLYMAASDLRGQLVFLVGRFPEASDKTLPPAKVLSYDFATKTTSNLWDVPRAGKLTVSPDGKWVGLVMQDPAMMASAEMSVFSIPTHETRHLDFRSAEVHAVIVEDYVFAQTGRAGERRIEVNDLRTGETLQVRLPANLSSTREDYTFVTVRMSEPNRMFFGYEPGGPRSGADYAGGTYAYDVATRKAARVQDGERSASGEIVSWEPNGSGWALVARKVPGPDANQRIICRFRDEEFNFKQLSPCLRYALMERNCLTLRGMATTYYLCDLRSGDRRLFLEAKPSAKTPGAFIGQVHWVRRASEPGETGSRNREKRGQAVR